MVVTNVNVVHFERIPKPDEISSAPINLEPSKNILIIKNTKKTLSTTTGCDHRNVVVSEGKKFSGEAKMGLIPTLGDLRLAAFVRPLALITFFGMFISFVCEIVSLASHYWLLENYQTLSNNIVVTVDGHFGLLKFTETVLNVTQTRKIEYAMVDIENISKAAFILAIFAMFLSFVGSIFSLYVSWGKGHQIMIWITACVCCFMAFMLSLTSVLTYVGGKPDDTVSYTLAWGFYLQLAISMFLLLLSVVIITQKPKGLPYLQGWSNFVIDRDEEKPAATSHAASAPPPAEKPVVTSAATSSSATTTAAATTTTVSVPTTAPGDTRPKCKALFDCTPDEAGDLAFKAGDIITIVKPDDDGWTTGELHGVVGLFPSNYVTFEGVN
ncbi:growth factor receptor-binding protein 2 [Pelomyxa schiedti]|nr:growth factor receptor-binding protein 2 [Pelomyxa schiedti]